MSGKEFYFEPPVRHELQSADRFYYTQALKVNGQNFYASSDWFTCNGIQEGFDKKKELLVPFQKELATQLKNIESFAIAEGLKVPVEFQSMQSSADIFKRQPDRDSLYIKLDYDVAGFDKMCKPLALENMVFGDYRVIIHFKGLYIGNHPGSGKLASVQLRISQIQYVPRFVPCLFASIPSLPPSEKSAPVTVFNSVPETPQPGSSVAGLAAKKGRKPKLQRQNAMIENRPQVEAQTQKLDTLPPEFFNEILSALPSN